MGRSNTLPLNEPRTSTSKTPMRSATTATPRSKAEAKAEEPTKHNRIHFPHLHVGHSQSSPSEDGTSTTSTTDLSKHHLHLPNLLHNRDNKTPSPPAEKNKTSNTNGSTVKPTRESSKASKAGPRPAIPTRQNSVQTRYISMLLAMDTIPRLHNILASFFTWILLAGFLVFPGTFTSLQSVDPNSKAASVILDSVNSIPLLVIAGVCTGLGAGGMVWLWWRWRGNFVWLLNRIFLPGFLNSFAGLISTLISVYQQQDGDWSVTARVTAIVTGAIMVLTAFLFLIYNYCVLKRVKRSHKREMEVQHEREGEGFMEKVERKAHEPALEPGSVV